MTNTALMPLDPSVSPQQAARVLSIRANLLPQEIRDGRRGRRTRAFVLVSLVLALLGMGGWYASATAAKSAAEAEYNQTLEDLAAVQRLQQKDEKVQRMITVRRDKTLLAKELKTLMAKDMSWRNLIELVRDTAEGHVTLNDIGAGLAEDRVDGGDKSILGSLQIAGNAETKKDVAEYVEDLGRLTYVSDPFVSSVTDTDKGVDFTLTVAITDDGLCGRFTGKCESKGK